MNLPMPGFGELELSGKSSLREVRLVEGRLVAVVDYEAEQKPEVLKELLNEEGELNEEEQALGGKPSLTKLKMKGEHHFDIGSGYIDFRSSEMDTLIEMRMADGAPPMKMPMKVKTKATTSMK